MLRNVRFSFPFVRLIILNEVLSLNAQECRSARCQRMDRPPQ